MEQRFTSLTAKRGALADKGNQDVGGKTGDTIPYNTSGNTSRICYSVPLKDGCWVDGGEFIPE